MSRGRLLFALQVEIARVNTTATRTAGAYDDVWRSPGLGQTVLYHDPIRLQAQVEMGPWQRQRMSPAGDAPESKLTLVFHYRELEARGLTDTSTGALLRVNDKLLGIYDRTGNILEQLVPSARGGLYAVEVAPAGLGLGGRRNLLVVSFNDRPLGLTANP